MVNGTEAFDLRFKTLNYMMQCACRGEWLLTIKKGIVLSVVFRAVGTISVLVVELREEIQCDSSDPVVSTTFGINKKRKLCWLLPSGLQDPGMGLSIELFKATNLFSIINKENEPPWEKVDDVGERENERSCLKVSKDKIKAAHVLAKLGMLRRSNLDYGVT
ncbi:hypothetical protein Tco_0709133 [Tanacetum coccineum]